MTRFLETGLLCPHKDVVEDRPTVEKIDSMLLIAASHLIKYTAIQKKE
ncbi:hypothetical protein HanHA89_Chr13g0495871 [Helianthus annuus]|nr:hypothetical protein HanHA89_Chr13g0495871 [Helianthus annuus]